MIYVRLLRDNPRYARLWIAQAISLLGDWFSTIALATLVTRFTEGSAGFSTGGRLPLFEQSLTLGNSAGNAGLAVSLLLLARFLPPLLVGPFAGVVADRFNRKRLLIGSDLLRCVIVLSFLWVTGPERLWLIYVLTILQFSLSALFEPCRSAILPSLVRPDDLVRANLLGSVTWSVMLAAGAAIGGLVAAQFGTAVALCIDASSFALSALFINSIRWEPRRQVVTSSAVPTSDVTTTRSNLGFIAGLRYVIQHPATGAALLIKMGGSVGSIDTLMIIYGTRLFVLGENGTESLGLLYGAFGIGAVLGPLLLDRFNNGSVRKMRRLIIVAYACVSLGWFLFSGAPILLLAALALTVKAMGSSIYWTYSSAIIQKVAPDQYLGRLFSLDLAGFQLSTVVSTLITGWLIDRAGVAGIRTIVFATGVASLIPLLLWTLALPWIERQTQTQEGVPDNAIQFADVR